MILGRPDSHAIDGVAVSVSDRRIELVAERDLVGLATGRFSTPSCGAAWSREGWDASIEFVGFAFTQFALPVTAGAALDFDFRPAPGLRSPPVVSPLIGRVGDEVVLLAPVDSFHEQVIAITADGIMWGWHGDLDEVPAGWSSSLGVYAGANVAEVLAAWREDLNIDPAFRRVADNPLSTHLSYWTDNGAAYWYRTEEGQPIADSVAEVVESLWDLDVPVRSVELDSWFYPHVTLRPIAEIGYPEEVPPTGMSTWSPRADAFPAVDDGSVDEIEQFAARLGRPPLTLHARHISPDSPYVSDPADWWVDEFAAHPIDPSFFRRWFDDARRWGATCIEQDWMLMYWFGIRALREVPGRAAGWQRGLNDHARATGVDLLWCMATPADMMIAAHLDRVIAIRSSDDYRFAEDPAILWTWFLTVNRLANTLGLPVFKDCFFSSPAVADNDDPIDGDRHAELEALLSALSGGPVGIGDRIGRTDREIVMRTCDADGRLRPVDAAVAAIDRCLFGGPARGEGLLWATTTATDDGGVWTYVLAINTAGDRRSVRDSFALDGMRTVYDWRRGAEVDADLIDIELAPRDWSLSIVCPPGHGFEGDPTKYVAITSGVRHQR